jgi:hypothetical protein
MFAPQPPKNRSEFDFNVLYFSNYVPLSQTAIIAVFGIISALNTIQFYPHNED